MVLFLIVIVMPHGIFRVITVENCIKFFKTIWHQHELKKYTSKNLPQIKLDFLKQRGYFDKWTVSIAVYSDLSY